MQPGVSAAESRDRRRETLIVLGVALLLRIFASCQALLGAPHHWFFSRGLEMGFMADSLAHGLGLSSPFGGSTGPTAMFAPIYPLLTAAVFRVFGSYTMASGIAVITIQTAVNLLVIWIMMTLARRQFGTRVALVAGWFWALSLPLWWLPTIFWDTVISLCLLTGLMGVALWVLRAKNQTRWIVFGAYCGATALYNPAMVPTILLVSAIVWLHDRRAWKHALLACAMFVLVYGAWPVRNFRQFHALVLLRTAPGLDLWMGNHPGASGFLEIKQFPIFDKSEYADYVRVGEIQYTHDKGATAIAYIRQEPGVFVRMTELRFTRFWLGFGTEKSPAIFVVHAALTTGFGLTGLWMLFRRRRTTLALLLGAPLLLFPLPYYVTHAEFRFRLVIDPILTLLAAYAAVNLANRGSTGTETPIP